VTPIPDNRAEFTAREAALATRGALATLARGSGPAVGFVTDSRAAGPGKAFVAISGATLDGHRFLGDALARGASLLVVRRGTPRPPAVSEGADVDIVEVDDTLVAWGDLARAHLRRWRRPPGNLLRTVAITGSSGKTTTKELAAALLRPWGACHATTGNLNNRVGVPAVALGVTAATRFAVLEVGMSERGEIAALAGIVEPDIGVLLNVGVAHAEGVGGSRAGVAWEKGALLEALGVGGTAIVNLDDEVAAGQALRTKASVRTFGRDIRSDYRLVERTSLGVGGSRMTMERDGERLEVVLPLLGEGAAVDFLAAFAAAEAALGKGLGAPDIEAALRECRPLGGRALLKRLGSDILAIDDTYNANPSSMRAALTTLAEVGRDGRRKVAVLGEMRELGSLAQAEHESLGLELFRAGVGLAIGCGGFIDHALDRAAALGVAVVHARDTEEAAELAGREVRSGDVILLKGSRAVAVERVLRALELTYGDGELDAAPHGSREAHPAGGGGARGGQ
jgi:UDP-N-acetylmuramoyl-tripeptide--D-alanyl-D-alanine ligase